MSWIIYVLDYVSEMENVGVYMEMEMEMEIQSPRTKTMP